MKFKVKTLEVDPASPLDLVEQDLKKVEETLATLDLQTVLAGPVRNNTLQSFRDNFTSSSSADGQGWPPRKTATQDGWGQAIAGPARKGGDDGHPLLIETGALLQAATGGGAGHITRVDSMALEVGINMGVTQGGIPAAARHQFGDLNKGLPARPFHDVSDVYAERIENLLADAILELL